MSRAPLEPTKRKELYRRFRSLSERKAAHVPGSVDGLEKAPPGDETLAALREADAIAGSGRDISSIIHCFHCVRLLQAFFERTAAPSSHDRVGRSSRTFYALFQFQYAFYGLLGYVVPSKVRCAASLFMT